MKYQSDQLNFVDLGLQLYKCYTNKKIQLIINMIRIYKISYWYHKKIFEYFPNNSLQTDIWLESLS